MLEEFNDLSDELAATESGLIGSYESFVGIPTTGATATARARATEILKDILPTRSRRAGEGSEVLTGGRGGGQAMNRMMGSLDRIMRNLENLTISMTVNNNIDGYKVNQALSKHQVRSLQTFI